MEANDGVGEAAQTIGPETIDHFTLITYWFFNSKAHFGRKATQRLTVPLHISLLISISEGVCRAAAGPQASLHHHHLCCPCFILKVNYRAVYRVL